MIIITFLNSLIGTFFIWGTFYYLIKDENNFLRKNEKLIYKILHIILILQLIIMFILHGYKATLESLAIAINLFLIDRLFLKFYEERKQNDTNK